MEVLHFCRYDGCHGEGGDLLTALISTPRFGFFTSHWVGKVLWRHLLWRSSLFARKEEAILEERDGEWHIAVIL